MPIGDAGLDGGHAEYAAFDEDCPVPVPDGIDLRHASVAACAIGKVAPADAVLVTGASGGVGLHAVQIAHTAGATVLAAGASPDRAAAPREAGAHHVVPHRQGEDFSAAVRVPTGGVPTGGVDVAIDTVGTPVFQPTHRLLARGAHRVLIGQLTGEFVPFDPARIFFKGISTPGATSVTREELRRCPLLLADGTVPAMVDDTLPLAAAAEAHRRPEAGSPLGRLTLAPGA